LQTSSRNMFQKACTAWLTVSSVQAAGTQPPATPPPACSGSLSLILMHSRLSFLITPALLAAACATLLSSCSGGGGGGRISATASHNPGYGPFDRHGNYVEAWADKPARKHAWASPEPLSHSEAPPSPGSRRSAALSAFPSTCRPAPSAAHAPETCLNPSRPAHRGQGRHPLLSLTPLRQFGERHPARQRHSRNHHPHRSDTQDSQVATRIPGTTIGFPSLSPEPLCGPVDPSANQSYP